MQKDNLEFYKILLSSFVSQIGSHFLTLSLSAFVLISSGSLVKASLIFVTSFLPSIFISSKAGYWIDRKISKKLLIRNEILSIILSIVCGFLVYMQQSILILCFFLAVRSIFAFINRTASNKWLKIISAPHKQLSRIKLYFFCFFISTAISGLLAAIFLKENSIVLIVLMDVVTYLISVSLFITLESLPIENHIDNSEIRYISPKLIETLKIIFTIKNAKTYFLLVCFSQAIFQGTYCVFISYLPTQHLKLSIQNIGYFQISASIGIILGFIVNWYFPNSLREEKNLYPKKSICLSFFGFMCILSCVLSKNFYLVIFSFCGFNFLYEWIWLFNNSEFFKVSPQSSIAQFQFTLSSIAAFCMSIVMLIYASLIQILDLFTATSIIIFLGIFGFLVIMKIFKKYLIYNYTR